MTSTQKTREPSENIKFSLVSKLFCFLQFHPFFVVYPLEGQMRQAVFEVSLHFGRSWPTVCRWTSWLWLISQRDPAVCSGHIQHLATSLRTPSRMTRWVSQPGTFQILYFLLNLKKKSVDILWFNTRGYRENLNI